jgi:hypothetical protein
VADRSARDEFPTTPVLRPHGRPLPQTVVAPVSGARARPPRDGPPPPPVDWPLPGERLPLDEPIAPAPDEPVEVRDEPRSHAVVRRRLGKALAPGEDILIADWRHPVVLVEPVLTTVAGFALLWLVSPSLGGSVELLGVLGLGWLLLFARLVWKIVQWRRDLVAVTDRRIVRLWGVFDSKRGQMPLTRVTDWAFDQPFGSKVVGSFTWHGRANAFGHFVLESAGKDQALREIRYVPRAKEFDAVIAREVFRNRPFQNRHYA